MPLPRLRHARTTLLAALSVTTIAFGLATGVPASASLPMSGPTSVTRIVSGTGPVTDASGQVWSPDTGYAQGGQLASTSTPIVGTLNQNLFRTERFDQTGYRIPVARQSELVTLYLAEHTWSQPQQRVFDVVAEGRTKLVGVDIEKAVGEFHAYKLSFSVTATDGFLDLSFVNHVNVASVTSLRIDSSGTASPAGGGPPVVTPESFGARGDGVTDDSAALQQAFDTTPAGTTVLLGAGKTYAHAAVLHLRTAGLHVTGNATLLATAEATSSVWLEADRVLLDGGVVVRTAATTQRWDAWEQMGLRLVGHSGITVRDVTVVGSAAAGVYVGAAGSFVLDHVTVQGTRADGIHITEGAHDGQVLSPVVRNSGDDGVAVVSYSQDGAPCRNITVTAPTVLGTSWGRGLSVVGGTNITETAVDVENTSAAGIYIASEGSPWFTTAPLHVSISGGTISGANTDPTVDHGAVFVMSGEDGIAPGDVTVQGLAISGTRTSASRNLGVITYGTAPTGVLFSRLTITGGPAQAYQGNTPTTSYSLVGVTHDGVAVPVHG